MRSFSKLVFLLFPVIFSVGWIQLDANPSLFFHNLIFPVNTNTQRSYLEQKRIWLTGGSSGIGASLVCTLVEAQAKEVIISSRNVAKLENVIHKCQQKYPTSSTQLVIVPYDAMDSNQTTTAVGNAIMMASDGEIDILMLNSGIYQAKPALDTSMDETRRLTRVNYEAPVELAMELMRQNKWKERGHGHIVVSASVMAKGPQSLCSSYAASKAALKNYFQTLSTEEFGWLKVQVAIIGGTKTNMWHNLNYDVHQPHDVSLMDPDRVAQLMVRAMSSRFWWWHYEPWITKNVGLLYLVVSHYTPGLHAIMTHMVGAARQVSYQQDHSDLLDLKAIIRNLAKTRFSETIYTHNTE
ncbi:unnamed protein product [Cylindrotheca closterium]|uniref:Protochlorophyllide reductase n=1 Tax=Cylindrotheca closterium TaxID=2856 RepID=A0AAD2FIT9_9STRA|nr:unnamed protein product [Cylindrotheca closterium]